MAFAFSALRWACAGFIDFSLGMMKALLCFVVMIEGKMVLWFKEFRR